MLLREPEEDKELTLLIWPQLALADLDYDRMGSCDEEVESASTDNF